ncbi:ATP-binding protein [Streptomyces sp. NPDC053474]|uniref:ATP-binding protein n=1 Tax=Streptomyces sp. NPDC053474 TaxID=3365704 RepID=UPI0037CEAAE5
MLETVALSTLTVFLASVGNGAAGEMGKQLLLSTGALARRATGRDTPLPTDREGWEALAAHVHARLGDDPRQAQEWALLLRSFARRATELPSGSGLPPATRHFTDRKQVVSQLRREATRPAGGRPRVALLHGPPGIGTTETALHLGATCHDLFPDGQFYVDLRDGPGDTGPAPAAVLLRLLRRMGVEPDRIPPTEAGREDLYRRLTAGRRAMVVIDHVTSVAQVRGLIPSTPEVFLLVVVSGSPVALEAELVPVSPLGDRDAWKMVGKIAGQQKAARAKRHKADVLAHCGGNAFALRSSAIRLRDEDEQAPEPVPQASGGDDPVRTAARIGCLRVRPETARLCRLTALGGWPTITTHLAAAAAGIAEAEAALLLADAADAQLLESLPDGRYRFRPEVRRYLADTAGSVHGVPECSAAVARTLEALLNRALHAAHAALPQSWRTEPVPARGEAYLDEEQGVGALAAEADNVVRSVFLAQEYGQTDTALRLARALWPLQLKAGHWDTVLPALRAAARLADEELPGSRMAGALHFQLGLCLGELGRWEEAHQEADAAVRAERGAGHLRGEASATELQGLLHLYRWQYEAAYARFVAAEAVYRRIAPGDEGEEDLPRALALSRRHRGRALRGMRRFDESGGLLLASAAFFAEQGEAYNQARALTDLAETLHDAGENSEALVRIAEAERLLPSNAIPHLGYLAVLRMRCEVAG